MEEFGRAARDWTPARGEQLLPLRLGQSVQLLWKGAPEWYSGRDAWYYGRLADGLGNREGYFPSYVLLGPPPPSVPPELLAEGDYSQQAVQKEEETEDTWDSPGPWWQPEAPPLASDRATSSTALPRQATGEGWPSWHEVLREEEASDGGWPSWEQASREEVPSKEPKKLSGEGRMEQACEVAAKAKITVRVATLGLEAVGIYNLNDVETCARSYAEGLRELSGRPLEVDFWLDARCFGDPDAGPLKHHIGTHPFIIERLVNSDHFAPWLRSAKRHFQRIRRRLASSATSRAAELDGDPALEERWLTVLVFCRSGRHRAVAAATVLRHVVAEHEGVRCPDPLHLCLLKLGGCRCYYCRGWRGTDVRDSALRKAADLWVQLP